LLKWPQFLDSHIVYFTPAVTFTTHLKVITQQIRINIHTNLKEVNTYQLYFSVKKEFEDTKGVTRIRKSKKDRQHNGQMIKVQKGKQRSKKHYT